MAYEFELGPYLNAGYGPKECPWGGPREGDDNDMFFLTRGEEDRFFFDSKWGDADWQDWNWKMGADYAEKKRRAQESAKKNQRMMVDDDVRISIVLMPRKGVILKTKREVDKMNKKK